MFAYCSNNPVCRIDKTGEVWGLAGIVATIIVVALVCVSSEDQSVYEKQQAKEKYNNSTVCIYESGNAPSQKKAVNAEVYYPSDSTSNIHIDNSLEINSSYEQDAVLDVIMDSEYYDESVYGSKSFMKAQWVAHNGCYSIASSGDVGFWLMQQLSGSDDPIESSRALDLRSTNNMLMRQRIFYTVISWFC